MAEDGLLSIGAIAARVGYSVSGVAKLERQGVIPAAQRIEGSNRRAWKESQVELIQSRIEKRRADRSRSVAA